MHFKQPGCTYSACGTFTKNKERTEKLKKTGDSKYIYQSQLDKACFQHDVAHRDFKGLLKITATDNFYVIKHLILLNILNMMGIKEVYIQWFINFSIRAPLQLHVDLLQAVLLKMKSCKIKN